MDFVNVITAVTWAHIGSSFLHFIYPYPIVYYTSYGILFYYTFQKTNEMDSIVYNIYGNGYSRISIL